MKNKYVTAQMLMICRSTPAVVNNIHEQLEQTIAERKKIIQELQQRVRAAKVIEMYIDCRQAA